MTTTQRVNALYAQLATDFSEIVKDTSTAPNGIWEEFYFDNLAFKSASSLIALGDSLVAGAEGFSIDWYMGQKLIYDSTQRGYESRCPDDILQDPNEHIRLIVRVKYLAKDFVLDVSVNAYGKVKLNEEFWDV